MALDFAGPALDFSGLFDAAGVASFLDSFGLFRLTGLGEDAFFGEMLLFLALVAPEGVGDFTDKRCAALRARGVGGGLAALFTVSLTGEGDF